MATAASLETCQKAVVSILQISQTAYGTSTTGSTPDGSNQQYASTEEIKQRLLEVDGELCTLIAMTMGHPFQSTFAIGTPQTITGPSANLIARNGAILRVQCQGSPTTATFLNSAINTTSNVITVTTHGMQTGQSVTYTCSATVPAGLTSGSTYYVIRVTANTLSLAATSFDAFNGVAIDITTQGTAGNTSTLTSNYFDGTQADSKDTVVQATLYPSVFGSTYYGTAGFWFIEGDVLYTTSPNAKVYYTDYIKTSALQAPEPYEFAIVAGTVAKILKDGGDDNMAAYYGQQYQQYVASIASGDAILPPIAAYKG